MKTNEKWHGAKDQWAIVKYPEEIGVMRHCVLPISRGEDLGEYEPAKVVDIFAGKRLALEIADERNSSLVFEHFRKQGHSNFACKALRLCDILA